MRWICVALASLIFFLGCVRVSINTPTKGVAAPKALPYPEQRLLIEEISLQRFNSEDTKISPTEVKNILDYASLVARCGADNDDLSCDQFFSDMYNDSGCKIQFNRKFFLDPMTFTPNPDLIPTFEASTIQGTLPNPNSEPDPLNCLADGVICSQSDLDGVWGVNPPNEGIKLVREISFCENTPGEWAACAQFPSSGHAIAIRKNLRKDKDVLPATDPHLQGLLWLHEFGHTKGLRHTPNALNSDPNSVMTSPVWEEQTKLNSQQCFKLREGLP